MAARAVYADVSDTCKAHVLTIYLMHSVALLDDDIDLGRYVTCPFLGTGNPFSLTML